MLRALECLEGGVDALGPVEVVRRTGRDEGNFNALRSERAELGVAEAHVLNAAVPRAMPTVASNKTILFPKALDIVFCSLRRVCLKVRQTSEQITLIQPVVTL